MRKRGQERGSVLFGQQCRHAGGGVLVKVASEVMSVRLSSFLLLLSSMQRVIEPHSTLTLFNDFVVSLRIGMSLWNITLVCVQIQCQKGNFKLSTCLPAF